MVFALLYDYIPLDLGCYSLISFSLKYYLGVCNKINKLAYKTPG